jgi:AbrB family looped-hinge helix DNA binding protein
LTLPKNVREQLGLKAGDKLDCSVAGDGSIVLRRKKLDVSDLVGILHVPGKHATIEEMNEAVGQAVVERVGRSKEQA